MVADTTLDQCRLRAFITDASVQLLGSSKRTFSLAIPTMGNENDILKIRPGNAKRPFNQKQNWAIRFFLDRGQCVRNRALFDLAIEGKLRGCDVVELKIGFLVSGPDIKKQAAITQIKKGRQVQFEIAKDARDIPPIMLANSAGETSLPDLSKAENSRPTWPKIA